MCGEESSGENSKRRAGQVHKSLWMSDADWGVVERRMRSYGQKNFSKFAREVLTNGIVTVAYSRSVADEITRALAPIGNNVNQIARKANTDGFASLAQLNEIFCCSKNFTLSFPPLRVLMAVVKIKKIYKTLKTAIEYISNPDKTRDGLLCSSNCGLPTIPESIYIGMRATEADALAEGARRGKILAYHVIQSFLPGEIEAEEAHRLGVEFLHEILGGEDEYNYTISTHTDRGHIHNHIIFHPRNTRTHKYYEMKRSAPKDYRRISNEITSREGYSRTYEWDEKDWESAPSKTLGGILSEAKPNNKKCGWQQLLTMPSLMLFRGNLSKKI
ncbi:relaxase/mobilization nuclease domain-containing protein [Arcanobacterium hippocoleae]